MPPGKVKQDLDMLRNDGLGPDDPQTALKQRLLDLTKKNRRMQARGLWMLHISCGGRNVLGQCTMTAYSVGVAVMFPDT